jgi:two-component system, chemotaxis family, chemotaxis protein CheY
MARIMIVDDSNFTRRTHRRILEGDGHVVHEASSGMSAIESYFVHRPDLVLLDLTMEDMTGLEVLAQLRAMQAEARVIVISADVQRMTVQLVTESGACGFLGKPVTPEGLREAVHTALGGAGS